MSSLALPSKPVVEYVELAPVAGTLVTKASGTPLQGWLVGVQPIAVSGSIPSYASADVYVRVTEVERAGTSVDSTRRVLWQGYMRSARPMASVPNVYLSPGSVVLVEAWRAGGAAALTVRVLLSLSSTPPGVDGGYLHYEAPGSGPGSMRIVSLPNPAAGSEFATQTVPSFARWHIKAWNGTLVTDAGGSTRYPAATFKTAGVTYGGAIPLNGQAASLTRLYRSGPGFEDGVVNTVAAFPMPASTLVEGDTVSFSTTNLGLTDAWSSGNLRVEEWAVP